MEPTEACDLGPGCSATCELLPCETRACQTGARDATGACVYAPADEGMPCEDQNACTHEDHCASGVCVGTHVPETASIRGTVTSFGAEPVGNWLEGLATFVSDDRIVFLESNSMTRSKLTLVQVTEDGLTQRAEATSDVAYAYQINSVIYWSYEPTTFVLPMSETRFAVVGSNDSNRGIEVFDIEGDAMHSRGLTHLPKRNAPMGQEDGITLHGAAARADAMWLCGDASWERRLRAYAYDDASGLFTKVADIATPSGGCRELALSPDGTRLFVGANGGYRVYDVTDPAVFAVPPMPELHVVLLPGQFIEDIDVTDSHVAVLTARPAGELADITLLDRAGTALGTLPPPSPGAVPFGMTLSGSTVYAQWGADLSTSLRYVASAHDLDAGLDARATFVSREGCCGAIETAVHPAARGDRVVLEPWRHVLEYDREASTLEPTTGPRHGSMRTVLPRSATEVFALGSTSSHRIDLADKGAPMVTQGGMSLPVTLSDYSMVRYAEGAPVRLTNPRPSSFTGVVQARGRERFTILDLTQSPPTLTGSAFVDGVARDSMLGFGGGALVQITKEGETGMRLRRFVSANIVGSTDLTWMPDTDAFVPYAVLPTFPRLASGAVAVAEDGSTVVVFAVRSTVGTQISQFARSASWFDLHDGAAEVVAEVGLEDAALPWPTDAAIAGDDALMLGNDGFALLHRDGASIAVVRAHHDPSNSLYRRILRFDGAQIFLSRHTWRTNDHGAMEHAFVVDVYDARDFSLVTTYDLPDEAYSLEILGNDLVFGTSSAVVVAAPECAP